MPEYSGMWNEKAPYEGPVSEANIVGKYTAEWHALHPPEAWESPKRIMREQAERDADPFIQMHIKAAAEHAHNDNEAHYDKLKGQSFDPAIQSPDTAVDAGRVNIKEFWNEMGVTSDRDTQKPDAFKAYQAEHPDQQLFGRQLELVDEEGKLMIKASATETSFENIREEAKTQTLYQSGDYSMLLRGETPEQSAAADKAGAAKEAEAGLFASAPVDKTKGADIER